jgi:hypothetical protein
VDWRRHGHSGVLTGGRLPAAQEHRSSPVGAQTHLGHRWSSVVAWRPGDGDEVVVAVAVGVASF